MEYLPAILTVAIVHLLAVISPGPDFIMVVRNSLMYSRKTGVLSAIGLGLGITVHIFYSLVGIGLLISKSVLLFSIIKYLGAAYLIYIGYKSLTAKSSETVVENTSQKKDISVLSAIRMGFLTNVTNPKVTLFFLSLFTLVIDPGTPLFIKLIMGAEMTLVTSLWFIFVTYLVSHSLIKNRVASIQKKADKFIGLVLIGLGIKVALSSSK